MMKQFVLTVLWLFILLIATTVIDFMLWAAIDGFVIDVLDWFNGLRWWVKLLVFFFGGGTIVSLVLAIVDAISKSLNAVVSTYFQGKAIVILSIVIVGVNIVLTLIELWKLFAGIWSFWKVIEFIILAVIAIALNTILLPVRSNSLR